MLGKQAIFEVRDYRAGVLHVPMWDGEVNLRSPSLKDLDYLGALLRKAFHVKGDKFVPIQTEEGKAAYQKYRLYTVGVSLCDENGERLFTDAEIETILPEKSTEAIAFIFDNLEEAFKKKPLTQSANSASD